MMLILDYCRHWELRGPLRGDDGGCAAALDMPTRAHFIGLAFICFRRGAR